MNGRYDPRILLATAQGHGRVPLDDADHLASYDGIVFDPLWYSFHGDMQNYQAPPGHIAHGARAGDVSERRHHMQTRAQQLRTFLERGGILVVRVSEPVALESGLEDTVDTYAWIMEAVAPRMLHQHPKLGPGALPAAGSDVILTDLHHPMAEAVRVSRGYRARIAHQLVGLDGARVIAENRGGDAIGLEIPCGRGAVLLLPARTADPAVEERVLRDVLRERPPMVEPVLTAERALDAEEIAIRDVMEAQLAEVRARRAELGRLKRDVLTLDHVSRAVAHLRRATDTVASERTAMAELYSLLEIVVKAVGGSREEVARELGIPDAVLKEIGRDSNQDEYGLRHTYAGPLVPLPPGRLAACREHGAMLLRVFLDRCVDARPGQT